MVDAGVTVGPLDVAVGVSLRVDINGSASGAVHVSLAPAATSRASSRPRRPSRIIVQECMEGCETYLGGSSRRGLISVRAGRERHARSDFVSRLYWYKGIRYAVT